MGLHGGFHKRFRDMVITILMMVLTMIAPKVSVALALFIALTLKLLGYQDPKEGEDPKLPPGLEKLKKISFTTRMVLLILFGTLPLMIAGSHIAAISICMVYNLIMIMLIMTDFRISPKPYQIIIKRLVAPKISIGEKNEVILQIDNTSFKDINVEILDEYPSEFKTDLEDDVIRLKLAKRTRTSLKYQIIPFKRGAYSFGDICIRYRGMFETVVFHDSISAAKSIEVYPNIKSISKFNLRMRHSNLLETGLISERKRGTGTDFESLREYVKGDEFRKIDWKATARRNKPISREYQIEVNQSVLIIIDCSRVMGIKIDELTSLDAAVNAALILSRQILQNGDKVGILTFSDKVHSYIPPGRGQNHFNGFLRNLYEVQPEQVEHNFNPVFTFLRRTRIKRSLLIFITNLTHGANTENIGADISQMKYKHLPVVISIVNPHITKMAYCIPNTAKEIYRKSVALTLVEEMRKTTKAMDKCGIPTLFLKPQEITGAVLKNYLKLKLRGRI